ncbi:MAG TPA: hypothetical protein VF077_12545 [Nitrospiraceae bacterium]
MPSVVPLIPITLDRLRHIRFDRRAVFTAELELTRLWGVPSTFYSAMLTLMNSCAAGEISGLNLNTLSILTWQGLLHESPELSLEQTQDMLPFQDVVRMFELAASLLNAWNVATVAPAGTPQEANGTADPLAPLTGSSSGVWSAANSG